MRHLAVILLLVPVTASGVDAQNKWIGGAGLGYGNTQITCDQCDFPLNFNAGSYYAYFGRENPSRESFGIEITTLTHRNGNDRADVLTVALFAQYRDDDNYFTRLAVGGGNVKVAAADSPDALKSLGMAVLLTFGFAVPVSANASVAPSITGQYRFRSKGQIGSLSTDVGSVRYFFGIAFTER